MEILFIEAQGSYVDIYLSDRKIGFSTHLKSLLEQMDDPSFIQVSRKHAVNIHQIYEIHNDFLIIGNYTVPTSKMYKINLLKNMPIIKTKQVRLIETFTA